MNQCVERVGRVWSSSFLSLYFLSPPSVLSLCCLEDRSLLSCSFVRSFFSFQALFFPFIFSWTLLPPSSYTFFSPPNNSERKHTRACTHTQAPTLRLEISIQHRVFVWGSRAGQTLKVWNPLRGPISGAGRKWLLYCILIERCSFHKDRSMCTAEWPCWGLLTL